jgi:hypothetical protein
VISEITAIACAVVIGWLQKCPWFAVYFCAPLALKLISAFSSVRRGPQTSEDKTASFAPLEDDPKTVIFEIDDYDHGFPLIEGQEAVIRQFFQHWGHPLRENGRDRAREIISITLIFMFVVYFPVGLLSMLWVPKPVQIMWLSYQLYLIVMMHVMRIRGSAGKGRTEEGLAQGLADGKIVAIKGGNGAVIMAKLESHPVKRIRDGRQKVQEIVDGHAKILKHRDSASSETTLLTAEDAFEASEKS